MSQSKEALVLFSGGKDSFLTTCLMIEDGMCVNMVTFENGAGLASHNASNGAERIIRRYGEERARFLGVYSTSGIWRELLLPFLNLKPSETLAQFGELSASQLNCLTCRSAMYVVTIMIANEKGIGIVGDGARTSQGFVIEYPCMISRFQNLFSERTIKLVFPVLELESDWRLKNLMMSRGFVPKTIEPQCLLGAPLPDGNHPDEGIQQAVAKYYDRVVLPRIRAIIDDKQFTLFEGEYV